jgi:hypothetical protein
MHAWNNIVMCCHGENTWAHMHDRIYIYIYRMHFPDKDGSDQDNATKMMMRRIVRLMIRMIQSTINHEVKHVHLSSQQVYWKSLWSIQTRAAVPRLGRIYLNFTPVSWSNNTLHVATVHARDGCQKDVLVLHASSIVKAWIQHVVTKLRRVVF